MAPNNQKDFSQLLFGVLAASLLLLLDLVGFMTWYTKFRSYVGYPVTILVHSISTTASDAIISTFHGATLRKENLELRKKVLELESLSVEYAEQLKKTPELKLLYEETRGTTYKKIEQAEILDLHAENLTGKLLLNKGSKNGVKVGMPVVIANFYLGYISRVGPFEATCTTFEIPGQEFIGYVQSKKITGIVRVGINGMELGDLLATEKVALHDIVTIKKDDFPYFFVLGNIAKIPLNNGSAERTAILTSPLDVSALAYVTIVKE